MKKRSPLILQLPLAPLAPIRLANIAQDVHGTAGKKCIACE